MKMREITKKFGASSRFLVSSSPCLITYPPEILTVVVRVIRCIAAAAWRNSARLSVTGRRNYPPYFHDHISVLRHMGFEGSLEGIDLWGKRTEVEKKRGDSAGPAKDLTAPKKRTPAK
jgi:hypothetical protein